MQLADLRLQMAATYEGFVMPAWPDPHPDGVSPAGEEYSRVSHPERYRVVHARADAWVASLRALPGTRVETLPPGALDEVGHRGRFDRGVRLTSPRPNTLPLVLLQQDAGSAAPAASMPVLQISVAQPEVVLERLPDCGCDACDSGSEDLLEAIDETIGQVVGGPLVVLQGKGWYARWSPGGGRSGGQGRGPDHARMMELCRRLGAGEDVHLPRGATAFVGQAWLD